MGPPAIGQISGRAEHFDAGDVVDVAHDRGGIERLRLPIDSEEPVVVDHSELAAISSVHSHFVAVLNRDNH